MKAMWQKFYQKYLKHFPDFFQYILLIVLSILAWVFFLPSAPHR
ncbi:MAG TPA: hypothetical protein VL651_10630 [Bacteroidia bacterium]|nr:hypothetical protein [Bacteroidia bacterium]